MSEYILPGRPDFSPATSSPARRWAVMCHLSWALGLFLPFGNLIGPLIVWLAKRHDYYEVNAHGKESLNFQISWVFYGSILGGLMAIFAFGFKAPIGVMVGGGLLFIGGLAFIILPIIAAITAGRDRFFRYPLTIRFLK